MQYTSASLNKLLKQTSDEVERIKKIESSTATFLVAIGEKVEDARPEYNYTETQAKINELDAKVRKIKHAINVFNSTTVVDGFDMTIDELLVLIPQLTKQRTKLSGMVNRPEKVRQEPDRYYGKSIIEYSYVNYDIEQAKADYDKVNDMLTKAQLALDKLNNSAVIELDV